MMQVHHKTLEEESPHVTDEARMLLPGVQTVLGFQFVAVFNQRFQELSAGEQLIDLAAFLLIALAMGLVMTPAAYHRQVERGRVTRYFVDLSSVLLTLVLLPLVARFGLDAYRVARLILFDKEVAMLVAGGLSMTLLGLWYGLPILSGQRPRIFRRQHRWMSATETSRREPPRRHLGICPQLRPVAGRCADPCLPAAGVNASDSGLAAFTRHFSTLIPEAFMQAAGFAVSFAVVSALFTLMFKWLPDAEVGWCDVWLGGVGTAALFEVGKFLISFYIGKQGLESTYGASASIVVVLIWVYYTAQIVLFGAEFTHVHARQRKPQREQRRTELSATAVPQGRATAWH